MADQQPFYKRIPIKSLIGTFVAGGIAFSSFMGVEDTVHKAYWDSRGKAAICSGHTNGVKMGDTATDAQCREYMNEDITQVIVDVLSVSPELADKPGPLQASVDFTLYSGIDPFEVSPMVSLFNQGKWTEGCDAFANYHLTLASPRRIPGYQCTHVKEGEWQCHGPDIVKRRSRERDLCLAQNP